MALAAYAVPSTSSPAPVPAAAGAFPAPPVALTVHDVLPTVTPAAVAQAMQDFARPAMSGSVTLITGSVKTVLKPAILGRHLAIEPDGHGGLAPKLDGSGIRGELDHDALAKLEQLPVDASFTVAKGQPVLVPGKNGVGYAPAAIQNAVLPVLTKTSSSQRVATVPIGPLPPALTTEAAQALGIRDVMGSYTAPFTAATQRTANVKRAAELVHGQIVQPGQAFSLNQVLGARTAANGFVPAGGSQAAASSSASGSASGSGAGSAVASAQDAGSGTSLFATALFNAEYLAGLKDVEHHPHATVTDHFPPGMEAAVAFPDVDLKFRNDSGAPVYLWTSATDNAVTVAVLGQKAYDAVQTETSPHYALVQPKTTYSAASSCVASDGVPGFQVDVTRTLTKAGQDPVRQVFHSSYGAQDKVVCGTAGSSTSAGGPGANPTGTPTGAQNAPTHDSTPSGPATPSRPPTGGATSGAPAETPSTSGSDGSLLGGLLGAPSSRH
jgi:vancomycin resistance protein YoaR